MMLTSWKSSLLISCLFAAALVGIYQHDMSIRYHQSTPDRRLRLPQHRRLQMNTSLDQETLLGTSSRTDITNDNVRESGDPDPRIDNPSSDDHDKGKQAPESISPNFLDDKPQPSQQSNQLQATHDENKMVSKDTSTSPLNFKSNQILRSTTFQSQDHENRSKMSPNQGQVDSIQRQWSTSNDFKEKHEYAQTNAYSQSNSNDRNQPWMNAKKRDMTLNFGNEGDAQASRDGHDKQSSGNPAKDEHSESFLSTRQEWNDSEGMLQNQQRNPNTSQYKTSPVHQQGFGHTSYNLANTQKPKRQEEDPKDPSEQENKEKDIYNPSQESTMSHDYLSQNQEKVIDQIDDEGNNVKGNGLEQGLSQEFQDEGSLQKEPNYGLQHEEFQQQQEFPIQSTPLQQQLDTELVPLVPDTVPLPIGNGQLFSQRDQAFGAVSLDALGDVERTGRPNMYTFYNPLFEDAFVTKMTPRGDAALIAEWKRTWFKYGWEPKVLNYEDAKKHPDFDEIAAQIETSNLDGYNKMCIYRWLAMATVDGGWMSDYDTFPIRDFSQEAYPLPNDGQMTIHDNVVPDLVSGTSGEWLRLTQHITMSLMKHVVPNKDERTGRRRYTVWSDMKALEEWSRKIPDMFKSSSKVMVRAFDNDDEGLGEPWSPEKCHLRTPDTIKAVHFSHAALTKAETSNMLHEGQTTDDRAQIAKEWIETWKASCEGLTMEK